jgi:hypothetical protein
MAWDRDKVIDFLKTNPRYEDFLKGSVGHIYYVISEIPFYIFKEEAGVDFYFRHPYCDKYDYVSVSDFISVAKPALDKIVEDNCSDRLMTSQGNIKPQIL